MKALLEKLIALFTMLWKDGKKFIQDHAIPVINFLNVVKAIAYNPALDVAVLLTPFGWDDAALAWFRKAITTAAADMGIVLDCLNLETPEEVIKCISDHLGGLTDSQKADVLTGLARRMSKQKYQDAGGTKLTDADMNFALETAYMKVKNAA
jgi:hypothetical protein